jgi:hypothetical protein
MATYTLTVTDRGDVASIAGGGTVSVVVSDGTGGAAGAVSSVNGHTGVVNLTSTDVGADAAGAADAALVSAEAYTDSAVAGLGGGAVASVNGQTGTVVLAAADVGAATAAQGALADSAVQPASLAPVATAGTYASLTGQPTLGTAAPLDVPATGDAAVGQVVKGTDSRLSNPRTPTAHKTTHATGGTDALAAADIGAAAATHTHAEADVTGLTTDLAGKVPTTRTVAGHALSADVTLVKADVGLGNVDNTADSAKTFTESQVTGLTTDLAAKLVKASNLSDLANAATARTNLGLAAIAASGSAADLGSGTVPTARLGTGTADATHFLRGDQTWAVPSGGGGSSPVDLLYTPQSGVSTIDEFNDGSLDAGWGRVDESGTTARATWVEAGDALSLLLTGSDSAGHIHAQMRAVGTSLAAGDALVTSWHVINETGAVPAATTFPAIIVADGNTSGAGSQIAASLYSGAWQAIVPMTNYQSLGTFTQSSMSFNSAHRLWLRLVKLASNVWRVDWSPNGSQWFVSANTITNTIVPTYIGIGAYNTTTVKSMVTFETFRRMSGVS